MLKNLISLEQVKKIKRFQIRDSKRFYGKYEVEDTKTGEIHKFHNLASARNWAKEQNNPTENEICTACECTPCDCDWGNK